MMQELNYICCGDYYIPDIKLPEETRPIGRFGRMHREYLREHNPIRFDDLCLSGELWTYLADLNEQAQSRLELIISQMKAAEGVTEDLKAADQMSKGTTFHTLRRKQKAGKHNMRCSFPLFFYYISISCVPSPWKCTPLIYEVVPQQILSAIFFQPFHRIAQPFLRGGYIPGTWYPFPLCPALRVRVM